jgi:hypothetical protein
MSGKAKTIRAWAVVCASGRFHRGEHKAHRLYVRDGDADAFVRSWDHPAWPKPCGPHTVVPLVGTFTPKASKRTGGA